MKTVLVMGYFLLVENGLGNRVQNDVMPWPKVHAGSGN